MQKWLKKTIVRTQILLGNLNRLVKQKLKVVKKFISTLPRRSVKAIRLTPVWLKSRPKAIRRWMKERRKKKKYRSFRLQKKIKPEPRDIPTIGELIKDTFRFLLSNKKIFFYILLIHAAIYLTIIRAPINANINTIQDSIQSVLGPDSQNSVRGITATLGTVITVSGTSQVNTTVLSISIVLMSLVYIWAIRELHVRNDIKARDAYYNGMAPLLSGALVLMILSIQLIPFAVIAFIYGTARTTGIFANGFEDLSIFLIALLTGLLSFYWMTSTVIALYIVTLPGMYPRQALRTAKKIVQFQRFTVFKRLLALPLVIAIGYILILALIIRFVPSQAFFFVECAQLIILPVVHVYLYKLYRALI